MLELDEVVTGAPTLPAVRDADAVDNCEALGVPAIPGPVSRSDAESRAAHC